MKRAINLICAAVACLFTVTSCALSGQLHPPAGTMQTPGAGQPGNAAVRLGSGAIGSTGTLVGVNLYAINNYTAQQTALYGQRMISYIKNVLHAQAVDIVWNLYQPSRHYSAAETLSTTFSAANVGILTRIAQQQHLIVEYRPLLFVLHVSDSWEGRIQPADPSAWFNSYYQLNLPYLQMAEKYHINEYVIGTEMDKLLPDIQWTSFLANCAKVYHGEITYASHENKYFPPGPVKLLSTQLTGVDMYEPIKLPATAPLAAVEAQYDAYFAKVPAAQLRRTAIQETGIAARAGAYAKPATLGGEGATAPQVQYNYFTAGCEAAKKYHLRAIFFWKVDLADNPAHPSTALSVFEGRQGAVAISRCESIISGS